MHNTRPTKKIKLDDSEYAVFDDPSHEKKATDIYNSGVTGSGYISGSIFMTWASANSPKLRAVMETEEETEYGAKTAHKFYIIFTGACCEFFNDLALHTNDRISLSLKGARVEKINGQLRACTLQMQLIYTQGVIIMFKNRSPGAGAGKIVDTWKMQRDWFVSPDPVDASSGLPIRPTREHKESQVATGAPVGPSKSQERRQKRAQRDKMKGSHARNGADIVPPLRNQETHKSLMAQPLKTSTENAPTSTSVVVETASAIELKAGLDTYTHKYRPLAELSSGQVFHLIGVVIHASQPSQSRTGDWCVNVKIVDPSSPRKNDVSEPEGLGINCFTKSSPTWLPQPSVGDILMLRHIQIYDVKGYLKGTGFHQRFQWTIYSAREKKVHHGNRGEAPRSQGRADDGSYPFTPFFDPGHSEVHYAVKLSDWWREIEDKRVKVVQEVKKISVAETSFSRYEPKSVKRQHRLIKDAGPDVQPNGYFDCTVEVLHGFMNHNDVYSLYVTDYTKNDLITPTEADWCTPELADYVLKIEMWDDAARIGPTMEVGTCYSISNARMRVSRGGYCEAKVVLQRIVKLDEEDAVKSTHFKDLLSRREAWKAEHETSANVSQEQLIQDVVEDRFFNCTVEVLHIVEETGYNQPAIYVTDYTTHPRLEVSPSYGDWCRGLEGRVLKISLWDTQASMAKSITPGYFYSIRNLRLKLNPLGDCLQGELRGYERRIHQLNPHKPMEELKNLTERKNEFLQHPPLTCPDTTEYHDATSNRDRSSAGHQMTPESSHEIVRRKTDTLQCVRSSSPVTSEHAPEIGSSEGAHSPPESIAASPQRNSRRYTGLKEMIAHDVCPSKFLVLARVVDFHPFSLKDCSKQFCTQCKKEIPSKYKACIECVDTEYEYVAYRYQVFLMLEDEEGTRIAVSAYDKSPVFEGLERANFIDNIGVYKDFCARLSPLLGNLGQVHDDGVRGKKTTPETDAHEFEVVSWDMPGDQRAYGLYDYKSVSR
ncbi:hypothetical protein AX17_002822 [Amanita inopinata Kibby_2008]|nr:hypothetical protein AX17_002822 [Amanita inopinata Kibby_2008]